MMKWLWFIVLLVSGSVQAQPADSVYHAPDHAAEFPEGNTSLHLWMHNNIHFPDSLFPDPDDLISKLNISFVVEMDGRLSEIRVLRGGTAEQNRYIAGEIKSMPRWKPATHEGKTVRSQVSLPMTLCYH